jgi:ketosteroid isomerase-like protein
MRATTASRDVRRARPVDRRRGSGSFRNGRIIMKFAGRTVLVCAALLALASTSLSASPTSPEDGFKAATKQWIADYNAGKVDAIVDAYADDAVMMPPDAPAATGHGAMRDFLKKDIAGSKVAGITLRIDTDSAGSSGDTGWHSGSFSVLGKDGAAVGTGKFVEVWQKRDGKWALIRDIWNNDAPSAPAPASATE